MADVFQDVADRTDGVETVSAADYNQHSENFRAIIGNGVNPPSQTIEQLYALITGYSIKSTAADYTILDDDGYGVVEVDSRTGDKTITLPTIADNQGRVIRAKSSYAGGKITLDGEGAETIDSEASVYLLGKDDYISVYGSTSEWKKLGILSTYDTGWIGRGGVANAWCNIHAGTMNVTYDNLVGAFTVGEVVTFASGVTGIVQADSGTVLKLKNMTGVGYGVNNETITGATSGATALVDEAGTGSSKNLDSDLTHDLNTNVSHLITEFLISTDGTDNNAKVLRNITADNAVVQAFGAGHTIWQVSANALKIQTDTDGLIYVADAGGWVIVDNEDWYYKNRVMRIM